MSGAVTSVGLFVCLFFPSSKERKEAFVCELVSLLRRPADAGAAPWLSCVAAQKFGTGLLCSALTPLSALIPSPSVKLAQNRLVALLRAPSQLLSRKAREGETRAPPSSLWNTAPLERKTNGPKKMAVTETHETANESNTQVWQAQPPQAVRESAYSNGLPSAPQPHQPPPAPLPAGKPSAIWELWWPPGLWPVAQLFIRHLSASTRRPVGLGAGRTQLRQGGEDRELSK